MYLAIVGSAEPSDAVAAVAQEVGALVAKSGATLVCGGLTGVMEAACRGAKSEGGTTVGILPGTRRSDANEYVDIALPTGLGEARNALVVRAADAVIAIAGEFGTLSEIGLALKMATPVVGLGTWDLRKGGEPVDAIRPAATAAEAVELAIDLAGRA